MRCGKELVIKILQNRNMVSCSGCNEVYPYILPTKQDMWEKKPSIMITNVWALYRRLMTPNTIDTFRGLDCVIIDEAHVYSHFLGGHVSYILKMLRYVSSIGNHPTFIFASATISNPIQFICNLAGIDEGELTYFDFNETLQKAGAKLNRTLLYLYLLPHPASSVETLSEAVILAVALWSHRNAMKAITFIDSISEINTMRSYLHNTILGSRGGAEITDHVFDTTREASNNYNWTPLSPTHVSDSKELFENFVMSDYKKSIQMHYGGLSLNRRAYLEDSFFKGDVRLLLSTSTLELGMDLSDVGIIMQHKLPLSPEGVVQRIGRAGRNPNCYRVAFGVVVLCLKDDELSGTQMVIVTGPRIDLAIDLIDRLKALFYDYTTFLTKETVLELNGVHIEAYPSHHLDSARGLPNVSFIYLDEADFFPKNQQQDARKVSKRYIAKSNPWIVMVSTPNAPGMLFESIEKEKDCIYHRIQVHWTVGLNKIFTQQEIDEQMKSASFNQEYGLQYLGIVGNLWSDKQIQDVITLGEQHKNIPISNYTIKSIGIDWGFSSSSTAIVMLEHVKDIGKIIVRHSEVIDKGDPNAICDKLFDIHRKYWNCIFWCDGSNRAATNLLKIKFGESLNWDTKDVSHDNMKVVPVNFATEHKTMLSDLQVMVTNKYLIVPESHKELIIGMRTAYAKDLSLDKEQTSYDDLIDATRLALKAFRIK